MSLKKLLWISILFTIVLLASVQPAAAQESAGDVYYVIQPGDTLTRIALRFGVTADAIIAANSISDPNTLYVGTQLIIPGVDWVQGVLEVRSVPFGETFRSLQRRYRLSESVMTHLGGLVSPNQLYMGYPMLMATQRGENLSGARAAVAPGTSLLEMAVKNNANPWRVVAENQLSGRWQALPGDVLFTGNSGEGPGALPSPISQLDVSSPVFVQGKTHIITVSASGIPLEIQGILMDQQLKFFDVGDGKYAALQGVHVMTPPGLYPLTISGVMADGATFSFSQTVFVSDGGYFFETITVEDSYLDADISAEETAFVNEIIGKISPEKLWESYFVAPSPYADSINSYFGTRRSFNGSAFIYYHSGVDFGGGKGVQIFAPAPGKVVYAGELEIRGNATIIDHGWGVYSGFWHQSEVNVSVGDIVVPGQVIGLVGNTGRSSGAHLHWELWVGGIQVEPLDWLYNLFP